MNRMRFLIVGVAACAWPGAVAALDVTGDAQVGYAYGEIDNNNNNDFRDGEVREWQAAARVGVGFGANLYGQFDVQYEQGGEDYDPDPNGEESSERHALTGHLGYRTERFHVGGFYSFQRVESINLSGEDDYDVYGVEGQLHFDRFSLGAQAGRADTQFQGGWHDVTFARLNGAYFFNPDFRLSGGVTFADGMVESVDDAPHNHIFVEARRRIGEGPLAGFVRYDRGELRNEGETPNDELTDNVFALGLSFQWGGATSLQEFERSGASLQSPGYLMRYAGYSQDFD